MAAAAAAAVTHAAVQFIRVNDATGAYEVTPEGRAMFADLPAPFGVVSVAGKYRTGKSYFLNRCLLRAGSGSGSGNEGGGGGKGFPVGSTVNSCTRGLWMQRAPPPISPPPAASSAAPRPLYVMDTEGIGALDATGTGDARIFSLALLLSSFFVYNSTNVIDEDAVSQLSLVTNVCHSIRLSPPSSPNGGNDSQGGGEGGGGENAAAVAAAKELGSSGAFPALMWMVRDFTLQLRRRDGSPMSPTEYLESALEDREGGSGSDDEDRNGIRRCIRDAFPVRSCVTVVRPASDEKVLHDLSSAPESALKDTFVRQMNWIRGHIFGTAAAVTAGGTMPLSGAAYVRYAELLCDAINAGRAPVLRSTWALLAELKTREAVAAGTAAYEAAAPGTDVDHEAAVVAAVDAFDAASVGAGEHLTAGARVSMVRALEEGWPRRRAAALSALVAGMVDRLPQLAGTGKLREETGILAEKLGGKDTVARALWETACALDERIGDADELRRAAEEATAAAAAAVAELGVAVARAEEAERKLEESLSIGEGGRGCEKEEEEKEKKEEEENSEESESSLRRMRLEWEAESSRAREQVARATRRAAEAESAAREAAVRCDEVRRAAAQEAIAHRAEVAALQAEKMTAAVETVARVSAAEKMCAEVCASNRELKRKLDKCDPVAVKRLRLEHRDVGIEAQRLRAELAEARAAVRTVRFAKERELTEALLRYGGTVATASSATGGGGGGVGDLY